MSRFHAQTGHFVLSSSPFSVSTEMRQLHFYLRCGQGRGLAVVRREELFPLPFFSKYVSLFTGLRKYKNKKVTFANRFF